MRRRLLFLPLVFFFLALWGPTPAAARSLVIESFDVEVVVNRNGSFQVTETIRPRFTGSWNGIYRTIPVEDRYRGFNRSLFLELLSITDERGIALRYKASRERHYQKFAIWVPGARDATRTVILRYRIPNGLLFFDDHDELYWDITGDEWEVPIESASARILLPEGATGVRALAFTGAYGSRAEDADVEIQGNTIVLRMRRPLGFREGLTAAVGWEKGLVREPGFAARAGLFLRSNWIFFIPVVVLGAMFWLWHRRGRDPRLRSIAPQYAPPEGLSPAELGTLVDNSPDMRDVTATLVDLAVRGYLVIEEKEEERFLGLSLGREYIFHLRKPRSEWNELKPHARGLLEAVFASGDTVELSDLENNFYKQLAGIRDRIFDELMGRGYYEQRPDKVKRLYLVVAVAVTAVPLWASAFLAGVLGVTPLALVISAVASGLVVLAFAWVMPARTLRGTRILEQVLGFEEFLSRVEADRYRRMVKTPEMFEKYLPFAMALGVEKNWVRAFEDIYQRPPEWYRGTNLQAFHARSFVQNLGRMSSRAAAAMASAPRGSGGSGFGGGGVSGGGFGGGGGGGF